jgi:ABC-type dipeptide/oligopeptide/nickel transport system permease component
MHYNLGYSSKSNQTASALIGDNLPKIVLLVGLSTILSAIIEVLLGVLQVICRHKPIDYVFTGFSFFLSGMPVFCIGTRFETRSFLL